MEVVIETQEEVIEQPVVIELSAECLSMVGGGARLLQLSEQQLYGDCVGQTSSAGLEIKRPASRGVFYCSVTAISRPTRLNSAFRHGLTAAKAPRARR